MSINVRPAGFPKWVVTAIWVSAVLIAVGSYRFLIADVALVMPAMLHHALERPVMFYLHVGLAPIALALLPVQFSKGLRKSRPAVHRWLGRLYGGAILLAGISGIWLAYTTEEGPVAAAGLGLLSVVWLWTTGTAIWHAMKRRIVQHRAWMIRSAALTLAAVTLRVYLPIGAATVGFEASYPIICWLAWVPNLMLAEWILRRPARVAAVA
ncbi:DUF2306 domain-containing protein [Phycobacter azelaicus]|uniref:DUF2306 domain-containing protein n=1 Tax=Phycobacter azelaicus TaxID=2668075 RepID=UPI00186740A4|nr:DUF2306 domain-containing protein [Phycobacter azelaicus]MBE1297223.1 DUF2306 domain-containing protein [Paracoccaceae bacterium]